MGIERGTPEPGEVLQRRVHPAFDEPARQCGDERCRERRPSAEGTRSKPGVSSVAGEIADRREVDVDTEVGERRPAMSTLVEREMLRHGNLANARRTESHVAREHGDFLVESIDEPVFLIRADDEVVSADVAQLTNQRAHFGAPADVASEQNDATRTQVFEMRARGGIESGSRNTDPKSTSGALQMIHLLSPGFLACARVGHRPTMVTQSDRDVDPRKSARRSEFLVSRREPAPDGRFDW